MSLTEEGKFELNKEFMQKTTMVVNTWTQGSMTSEQAVNNILNFVSERKFLLEGKVGGLEDRPDLW